MLYSFDSGERFEPGSPTSPGRRNSAGMEQDRILVEPKGEHLIAQDKWKEDFLLQIESRSTPRKTVADDNENYVRGFPFYNQLKQTQRFDETLNRVLPQATILPPRKHCLGVLRLSCLFKRRKTRLANSRRRRLGRMDRPSGRSLVTQGKRTNRAQAVVKVLKDGTERRAK